MSSQSLVTAVIINFQTPDLTRRAVISFRTHYPTLPLLLIDNGSKDESISMLEEIRQQSPACTDVILNSHNLHHGPAMDQALRYLQSPYVLFIDSDCEILKGGYLESMLNLIQHERKAYAIGKRIYMNKRGFDIAKSDEAILYIRPIFMLINRELYLTLPPFQRHGTPCLENMRAATEQKLLLIDFPVELYIQHRGRGTAERYGYNLGWCSKLQYLLNKLGL
ncbi:MAG: glycosyltransferase family 2 protein [Ignavibacteriae bacterium]|nr:glycosyltransferase family 2 protein [Ignavibacteriota bacterium]